MNEPATRRVTEVAVGVLIRPDGAVLLADRPSGKPYAGYWEFPGGKIEAGEDVAVALARELHEELGITIGTPTPWVVFEFDYPHAYVRLFFERVFDWCGSPCAHEGQRFGFFAARDKPPAPLLPAAVPAMRWLRLPDALLLAGTGQGSAHAGTSIELDVAAGSAWVVAAAAATGACDGVAARAGAFGVPVLGRGAVDDPAGCVLSGEQLRGARARPPGEWVGAFAENRADLDLASRLGCDFVLVGPVLADPATGSGACIGWHGFTRVARHPPLPVFAYGGLVRADLDAARRAGAHGVATSMAAT